MSSDADFVSRILRRTSSVGFSAVIGVGQSAFGATEEFWSMSPKRRLVELSRKSTSGENVSWN